MSTSFVHVHVHVHTYVYISNLECGIIFLRASRLCRTFRRRVLVQTDFLYRMDSWIRLSLVVGVGWLCRGYTHLPTDILIVYSIVPLYMHRLLRSEARPTPPAPTISRSDSTPESCLVMLLCNARDSKA